MATVAASLTTINEREPQNHDTGEHKDLRQRQDLVKKVKPQRAKIVKPTVG